MATRIPESFLEDLRATLPVSTVVARRCKDLKRVGSEWKCLSPFNQEKSPSFTVNDNKRLWMDFSSGKGGDIFKFEMEMAGSTFMQAVEDLAEIAGISVPGHEARRPATNGQAGPTAHATKRNTVASYDYTDADGALLYQVCRQEWTEEGKHKKTFLQRRKAPGKAGGWIWGLDAATYVKGKNGDWYRQTEARESWPGPRLEVGDEVPHSLYHWPALREEMGQPAEERRVIWTPEGEKDCDTLAAWGLIATDSSGGSKNWSPHHAEELRGADVVVLMDNDKSGRVYAHTKASSLRGIAARVRVLDWRDYWPDAPDGADVTDWRDHADGNKAKLFQILERLQTWTPTPPESSFNAVRFVDLDRPAREHEWLIKKILTRGEVSIWFGPPACGKSFLVTDAGLSIARGVSWFGMRVRQGLVIYQAGEGGLGLKKRMRAYRNSHRIAGDEDIPFVLLPSPVDLYRDDADADKLIAEIKAWAAFYDAPLELVVIDTFSAATPGANENASEDVSRVLSRCRKVSRETGAHVALVHHTTKAGTAPRGHSSLTGNVENAIEVIRSEHIDHEDVGGHTIMRDIREFVVRKQKDGEDGLGRQFILRQVQMGIDLDQEPETSCIVSELAGKTVTDARPSELPRGFTVLRGNNLTLMKALDRAIEKIGRAPPATIMAPPMVRAVVIGDWQESLREMTYSADQDDPDGARLRARCKKAIERTYTSYGWSDRKGANLIVKEKEWVWRSSRQVLGIDAAPKPKTETAAVLAPGEDMASLIEAMEPRP